MFVSSHTAEFETVRADLAGMISSIEIVNSRRVETAGYYLDRFHHKLMIAEVVELDRGTTIGGDIKKALDRSQVYLGMFGREFSDPTVAEFHYARTRGLHTLVYYFTQPPRIGNTMYDPVRRTGDPVVEFLFNEVKSRGIRIRGNYSKISVSKQEQLEDEMFSDLASLMLDMASESAAVRSVILETLD